MNSPYQPTDEELALIVKAVVRKEMIDRMLNQTLLRYYNGDLTVFEAQKEIQHQYREMERQLNG